MANRRKTTTVEPKTQDWLICPRCAAGSVVHRSKTKDFICKRCGAVFIADFNKQSTYING